MRVSPLAAILLSLTLLLGGCQSEVVRRVDALATVTPQPSPSPVTQPVLCPFTASKAAETQEAFWGILPGKSTSEEVLQNFGEPVAWNNGLIRSYPLYPDHYPKSKSVFRVRVLHGIVQDVTVPYGNYADALALEEILTTYGCPDAILGIAVQGEHMRDSFTFDELRAEFVYLDRGVSFWMSNNLPLKPRNRPEEALYFPPMNSIEAYIEQWHSGQLHLVLLTWEETMGTQEK